MAQRFSYGLLGAAVLILGSADRALPEEGSADADAQAQELVQVALEYELEGENGHRQFMVTAALKAAPDLPEANWHAGRVQHEREWIDVADAQRLAAADPVLAQYRELRPKVGNDPSRQLALARWCARQERPDLARLHYTLLAQNPQAGARLREEALKSLNLRNVGGVLMTEEELRAHREAAEQIERAIARWRPKFEEWREPIENGNPKQREFAVSQLNQIDDPHVITVAETFLGESGPQYGEQLARLLGRRWSTTWWSMISTPSLWATAA
jgi:hypothetical protein